MNSQGSNSSSAGSLPQPKDIGANSDAALFITGWTTVFAIALDDMGSCIRKRIDLNVSQARLLLEAHYKRHLNRAGELAKALRIAPNTATYALNTLVSRGLLTRTPSTHDGRGIILSLTEDGGRAVAAIEEGLIDYRQRLEEVLSRKHLDAIAEIARFCSNAAGCPNLSDGPLVFMVNYLNCAAINLSRTSAVSKEHGLTLDGSRVLAALATMHTAPRVNTLSSRLGIRANVISLVIDELASDGLALRSQDKQDHRAVRVSITPEGKERFAQIEHGISVLIQLPSSLLQDIPEAATAHLTTRSQGY